MQKWLTEFAMKMSDCPLLRGGDPHLNRHAVPFPWHLSTCYFPPLAMLAKGVVQPLYDVDARNQCGVGSCLSETTTLRPPPTLLSVAQRSSVILAAGKKNTFFECFFLNPVLNHIQCTFLILWKEIQIMCSYKDSSSFPCKNLPNLSSPLPLQNDLICIWFKDQILIFFFSYIDPADIQMVLWKLNFDIVLLHSDLGYIPCCSKLLQDNFHPWRMCLLGSEPESDPP